MLGIRTDANKAETSEHTARSTDFAAIMKEHRRPINMDIQIEAGKPVQLHAESSGITVNVCGTVPDAALTRPLTEDAVIKNLEKLGSSPFSRGTITVHLEDGLIMPLSAINALRRDAVEELTQKLILRRKGALPSKLRAPEFTPAPQKRTARFHSYESIPENASAFDAVYLPLEKFTPETADKVNGVIIPPVVFDSEADEVKAMLKTAAGAGIRRALVSNIGHIKLAKDAGMIPFGDFRLNIFNAYTAEVLDSLGISELMASPELTLPQLRDLGLTPIIYGRVPLMTLEKCAIKELYSCEECAKHDFLAIRDRKGTDFPTARAWNHRNIMYNSVPVYMEDKKDELIRFRIGGGHYIFTDETKKQAADIISAKPAVNTAKIRRIPK